MAKTDTDKGAAPDLRLVAEREAALSEAEDTLAQRQAERPVAGSDTAHADRRQSECRRSLAHQAREREHAQAADQAHVVIKRQPS